jgi:hypothetical protein
VDGIGNNSAPANGDRQILNADAVGAAPRFLLRLDNDSVGIAVQESFLGRIQIEDVLFGPFDLDPAAGIPSAA